MGSGPIFVCKIGTFLTLVIQFDYMKRLSVRSLKLPVILLTCLYLLNGIVGAGFNAPFVFLQAALTPKKTVIEFPCDGGYSLKVEEKTSFRAGNKLEIGTESALAKNRYL